jgi:hypothetical protein
VGVVTAVREADAEAGGVVLSWACVRLDRASVVAAREAARSRVLALQCVAITLAAALL